MRVTEFCHCIEPVTMRRSSRNRRTRSVNSDQSNHIICVYFVFPMCAVSKYPFYTVQKRAWCEPKRHNCRQKNRIQFSVLLSVVLITTCPAWPSDRQSGGTSTGPASGRKQNIAGGSSKEKGKGLLQSPIVIFISTYIRCIGTRRSPEEWTFPAEWCPY